ncbi:YbbR domain-containing protein [Lentibacillus halodurans]|uniref:YbbR domain-containing protein n=1 Tax=Lentibacillus halodurans TaxID=237679 RepID=A0A1I0Y684_9BACI|nr:CdaR family protein [Lentibacillus halodurans]SFB08337.1 YbbR domain-containing protein [Lentibacillus halodurans]
MDNWFKSPWFVRAISLAFAIALYVFVQVEIDQYQNDSRLLPNTGADVQTVDNVPVNIRIDEENYVVSGVPEVASVTLEGTTGTVTATARQQNFDIFVDLEGLEEGTHSVTLQHTGVPEELNVYIEPKTIEVTIEERSSEQFDVAVDFINTDQLPEGYEIGQTETDPGQVTITSSTEVIEQIAIVKVFVDVAGITEPIDNREVPVNAYDASGNELNVRVEPESVNVSVDIDNPSKSVPVNVQTTGELSDGYSLSSISANLDEVEVFATNDVLQDIEEVSTEEIELADITESGTIDVGLALPDGASIPDTDTIEVTLELEQTRTFEAVPIDVENLDTGQDISFVQPESQEMDMTVTGNQEDVSELTAEDFNVLVDAAGLEDGEHNIPITIEAPEDVDADGEFEQVTVEISG